jgi:uncharacterized membrane protein
MSVLSIARRAVIGRPRLFVGVVSGLICYPLLPGRLAPHTRGILAWDFGVTVFLALVAAMFTARHHTGIARDAERQQEGKWTIFWLTVGAIVASFAVIVLEFSASKESPPAVRGLHVALVAYTLFASWLMTHTAFALRYAHEYYETSPGGSGPDKGLEFPGDEAPDYWDFFYFAMVLGMTFQVSDVQITSRMLRRLATVHGLLGFLFNTVIIALTVNIGASLL